MTYNKYKNKKTPYMGVIYDSKKEAEYAQTLNILRKAKNPEDRVVKVERQPKFAIIVKGKKICDYFADFRVKYADDRIEIVDVKGLRTDVYKLKKKLVEALYPVKIIER